MARPGPRRALSEPDILEAALGLLDRGGVGAASIRNIAAKLGVAPNAVYTYFPNKAAVIAGLIDRLLGDVDHDVSADRTQPWRQRAEALALELRSQLLAHPAAVQLMIGGRLHGPNARRLGEHTLELFADAGLDPTEAARSAYLLIVFVLGSMALAVAEQPGSDQSPPGADRVAGVRQGLGTQQAALFPLSAAALDTMAGSISADQYEWGLQRLLDGIATLHPTDASGTSARRGNPRAAP